MPISIASAPASATARTTSSQPAPRPPVTYGTRSLRAGVAAGPRGALELHSSDLAGEALGDLRGVLVAAARQRDAARSSPAGTEWPASPRQPADRVRRLERGDDALGRGQQLEAGERLVVGGRRGTRRGPIGGERGVLRADARVVEAGADRVGLEDLAVLVLEEQRARAVQHAGHAAGSPTRRAGRSRARDRRPRPRRAARRCRGSRRTCPSRSTRRRRTRRRSRDRHRRGSRGTARAPRRRRRAGTRARSTGTGAARRPSRCSSACVSTRRDPVAQRLVDRVLERRAARLDRDDLGAEQLHAPHVQRLALDVDRAHEHRAVEPEQRGARSRWRRRAGPRRSRR